MWETGKEDDTVNKNKEKKSILHNSKFKLYLPLSGECKKWGVIEKFVNIKHKYSFPSLSDGPSPISPYKHIHN